MASSKEYLDFVLEQLSELDDISYDRELLWNIKQKCLYEMTNFYE